MTTLLTENWAHRSYSPPPIISAVRGETQNLKIQKARDSISHRGSSHCFWPWLVGGSAGQVFERKRWSWKRRNCLAGCCCAFWCMCVCLLRCVQFFHHQPTRVCFSVCGLGDRVAPRRTQPGQDLRHSYDHSFYAGKTGEWSLSEAWPIGHLAGAVPGSPRVWTRP